MINILADVSLNMIFRLGHCYWLLVPIQSVVQNCMFIAPKSLTFMKTSLCSFLFISPENSVVLDTQHISSEH